MNLQFTKDPNFIKNNIPYFGSEKAGDEFDETDVISWTEGGHFARRWQEKGQTNELRNNVWMALCKQAAELNLPIIELACGPNMGLLPDIYAINPNIYATATDACPMVVEHWNQFIRVNAPTANINFASFDAINMPLASNSVDVITSFVAFGSLRYAGADQLSGIKEAYRVLKPGGYIFTVEMEFEDMAVIQQVFDKWGQENWFKDNKLTWRKRFEQSGFVVEQENFMQRRQAQDWELGDVAASFGMEIWSTSNAYVLQK